MMFAPLRLFALGREEECCLLGALLLVVNVSTERQRDRERQRGREEECCLLGALLLVSTL